MLKVIFIALLPFLSSHAGINFALCARVTSLASRPSPFPTSPELNLLIEMATSEASTLPSTPGELIPLAKAAMLSAMELQRLDMSTVPKSLVPQLSSLEEAFPWLKHKPDKTRSNELGPATLQGFQKLYLQGKLEALKERSLAQFDKVASPEQRVKAAKELFDAIPEFGEGEYEQSRLDQLIRRTLGSRAEALTKKIKAKGRAATQENGEELWTEYGTSMLLTRYALLRSLFGAIPPQPGETVVDIGSGFGDVGFYVGTHYPTASFHGFELQSDRVEDSQRVTRTLGLKQVDFHRQDLSDTKFRLPFADIYYAFNPVSGKTFEKVLRDLHQSGLEKGKPFKLIVTGPADYAMLEAQPWLKPQTLAGVTGDDVRVYRFEPPTKLPAFPGAVPLDREKHGATLRDALDGTAPSHWIYDPHMLNGRYATQYYPNLKLSEFEGATLITSEAKPGELLVLKPMGVSDERAARIVAKMLEHTPPGIQSIKFEALPPSVAEKLADHPQFRVTEDDANPTYIYRATELAKLEGSKFRDKRNRINHFTKNHPSFDPAKDFHDLRKEPELLAKAQTLAEEWLAAQDLAGTEFEAEAQHEAASLRDDIKHFKERDLYGAAITVNGKVVGFCIGGKKNKDTMTTYYEKGDRRFEGVYQVLNQMYAERVVVPAGAQYIDRQTDGGDANARRAKRSYNPVEIVKWFNAERKMD